MESALSLRTKQDTGDFDRQRRTETEREQTHLQAINKTRTENAVRLDVYRRKTRLYIWTRKYAINKTRTENAARVDVN